MFPAMVGSDGGPQYFVERPENQVINKESKNDCNELKSTFFQTAIEGEDVLLRCRVGNLQGRVQWTRNGFAMGKKETAFHS